MVRANDNTAADQVPLLYAGRITSGIGTLFQVTYDGVARQAHLDNVDIRHSREGDLLGVPVVFGLTVNNDPGVQDLWDSVPVWGFPYDQSRPAPKPPAAALVDGRLAQRVAGLGAYALWDDWLYTGATGYQGLGRGVRNRTGTTPVDGADDGEAGHASGNNALYLGTWGAVRS